MLRKSAFERFVERIGFRDRGRTIHEPPAANEFVVKEQLQCAAGAARVAIA